MGRSVSSTAEMEDLGEAVLVPRMVPRDPRSLAPLSELSCGALLGGYVVAECVGTGSFAHVYRLEQPAAATAAAAAGAGCAAPAGVCASRVALKAIERRSLSAKSAALLSSEVRKSTPNDFPSQKIRKRMLGVKK